MNRQYTHITYIQVDEEIHATLVYLDRTVGHFDIIGDWEDNDDIMQSLHEEASRQEYECVPASTAAMREMGRRGGAATASKMTKKQRIERAKKAVAAREEKRRA
jgi:hypothetical protein